MCKRVLFYMTISMTFFFLSCDQATENKEEKAKSSIERANEALATVLYNMINGDRIADPGELDFTEPYRLYKEAYNYDKSNLDANFGLGLTSILTITQDQDIQDAIDEWTAYLESNVPFEAPLAKRTKTGFPISINEFKIPVNDLAKSITGTYKMVFLDAPKFSAIQDLLEAKLLVKLNFALQALEVVDDHPEYKFILTPKMQGDMMADPLEIDLTEIYALEVGLNLFSFLVNMGVSYNVDFNTYDSLGIIQTFSPGSSFMTIRQSGQYLTDAKNRLLTMANKVIAGINFLRDETDGQNDDIIKIDPQDEAELDDVITSANDFLDMMTTGYTVTANWDDNSFTPDEPITFDFSEYFDDPIQDFKQLLPAYTVLVGRDTVNYDYNWDYGYSTVSATINIPQTGYYYYSHSYNWSSSGYVSQYADSNLNIPEFKQAADLLIAQLKATPNIRNFYVNLNWGAYLEAGTRQIQQDLWWDLSTESPSGAVFIPVITWNADSFQEWILPDPTFSDILPGMTDSEFKRIFGITADGWTKSTAH